MTTELHPPPSANVYFSPFVNDVKKEKLIHLVCLEETRAFAGSTLASIFHLSLVELIGAQL